MALLNKYFLILLFPFSLEAKLRNQIVKFTRIESINTLHTKKISVSKYRRGTLTRVTINVHYKRN